MLIEEVADYSPNIAGGPRVTVYYGRRVALVIDAGCADLASLCAAHVPAVADFIQHLEMLLQLFDDTVGKAPENNAPLRGRVRYEIAFIDAAGLAHHGVAGIACGPAFLESSLRSFISAGAGIPEEATGLPVVRTIHHVFCYETCRNYIFPEEFTPVFDYACLESPDSWGWVNQGFINILGCLLLCDVYPPGKAGRTDAAAGGASGGAAGRSGAAAGIGVGASSGALTAGASDRLIGGIPGPGLSQLAFDYYGHDAEGFIGDMEKELVTYAGSDAISWEDAFMHERLPWNKERSLDNLYSGLLAALWRSHGRKDFLRRWFRGAIPILLDRCPKDKSDIATAADNFFLAACYAARADLTDWFELQLRWPISEDARGALDTVLAIAASDAAEEAEIAEVEEERALEAAAFAASAAPPPLRSVVGLMGGGSGAAASSTTAGAEGASGATRVAPVPATSVEAPCCAGAGAGAIAAPAAAVNGAAADAPAVSGAAVKPAIAGPPSMSASAATVAVPVVAGGCAAACASRPAALAAAAPNAAVGEAATK
jgi:hypothetical protein